MNGVYLRALPTFDLAERLIAYLRERGSPLADQPARVAEVTPLAQEKIATLAEFEPLCSFLFGPIEIDAEAWDASGGARARGRDPGGGAGGARDLRVDGRETSRRPCAPSASNSSSSPASSSASIRVAVTGSSISPGLFESVHLLGRDEALARLSAAAARLA